MSGRNPNRTLTEYIINKLDMLENEFYIRLTGDEYDHMWSMKTELEVDQYAHDLIITKL